MRAESGYDATCSEDGCTAQAFNEEHALHQGWSVIELGLYCPLHAPAKGRQVARKLDRQLRERQIAANAAEVEAKRSMTTGEYAAWFGFQQDLVTYQREHGVPAPKHLTGLGPRDWLKIHRSGCVIDVESEAVALQEHEKAVQAVHERFARGV